MRSPGRACPILRANAASPCSREHGLGAADVRLAHLQHGAEFLGEKRRDGPFDRAEVHVDRGAAGEGHLEQCDREAAVRSVVVSQQEPGIAQIADRREKRR